MVCWGQNWQGELGDGTTDRHRTTPVAVSGLSDASAIGTGGYHTCALRQDGGVVCWGNNSNGELGNADMSYSPLPVTVIFPPTPTATDPHAPTTPSA